MRPNLSTGETTSFPYCKLPIAFCSSGLAHHISYSFDPVLTLVSLPGFTLFNIIVIFLSEILCKDCFQSNYLHQYE